jgi:hypothetical protein
MSTLALLLLLELTWSVAPFFVRYPHPALDWTFFVANVLSSLALVSFRVVLFGHGCRGWLRGCGEGGEGSQEDLQENYSHHNREQHYSQQYSNTNANSHSCGSSFDSPPTPPPPLSTLRRNPTTPPYPEEVFASHSIITGNVWHANDHPGDLSFPPTGHPSPRPPTRRRSNGIIKYGRPDVRFADTLAREEHENKSNMETASSNADKTEL